MSPTDSAAQISDRVQSIISNLDNLRPFPAVATRLLDLCNDAEADVDMIVQLVECEPTIAARVLSLANSPFYGATRPISTISHALVVLGLRSLSQIAVSIAAGQLFDNGSRETQEIRQSIFSHSIGCATVSRLLARLTDDVDEDQAFLSGVMHDVGKLILFDACVDAGDLVPTGFQGLLTADDELVVFGCTHADTGRQCGTVWGLPPDINRAISDHHLPIESVESPLSRVTIIANHLSKAWTLGLDEASRFDPDQNLCNAIDGLDVPQLEDNAKSLFSAVHEIFGSSRS